MTLRPYQQEAIDLIHTKRPLLYLATGSGKSVIFKEIARRALSKGNKVCFIVYGKSIVDQAAKKHFSEITKKICVIMGPEKYRPHHDIYCCSISTLARSKRLREQIIKECPLLIVDEAHNAVSDSYQELLNSVTNKHYVIGLTATPFRIGKKGHTFWDDIIHPITTYDLMCDGHLVEPKVYGPPGMSTKSVKTTAGDYNNAQLFKANDDMKIYGDILESWKKFALNRKTICFCINRQHAQKLNDMFNKNGIKSEYADADTPQDERMSIFNRLASGETKILTNVNIASTGVDIPEIECVISARPTKSKTLWIQQVGRGLRPAENKKDCVIIDHGGNCDRLRMHPLDDFPAETTDKKARDKDIEYELKFKTCPDCFKKLPIAFQTCDSCGYVFQTKKKKEKQVKNVNLVKKEFKKPKEKNYDYLHNCIKSDAPEQIVKFSLLTIERIKRYGHKPASYYYKMHEQFGNTPHIGYPSWFLTRIGMPSIKSSQNKLLDLSKILFQNPESSSDT
jgi:DNA repair protein RadD